MADDNFQQYDFVVPPVYWRYRIRRLEFLSCDLKLSAPYIFYFNKITSNPVWQMYVQFVECTAKKRLIYLWKRSFKSGRDYWIGNCPAPFTLRLLSDLQKQSYAFVPFHCFVNMAYRELVLFLFSCLILEHCIWRYWIQMFRFHI